MRKPACDRANQGGYADTFGLSTHLGQYTETFCLITLLWGGFRLLLRQYLEALFDEVIDLYLLRYHHALTLIVSSSVPS